MTVKALPNDYGNALAAGTRIDEYVVESVLGAGGFGITYLARGVTGTSRFAIKEYFPADLAMRALDGSVVPVATERRYTYEFGLNRFAREAQALEKFRHRAVVGVLAHFEANNSAYMVMPYEDGESLSNILTRDLTMGEERIKGLLRLLLDGLQAVHDAGFLHRDIKPSNIFIRTDGRPLLIDFGAARLTVGTTKSLSPILTPGYAALERYSTHLEEGTGSDLYSMAAVIFRAITGQAPPDPVSRLKREPDPVAVSLEAVAHRYSRPFLDAIRWGLAVHDADRPDGVRQWRSELFAKPDKRSRPPREDSASDTGPLIVDGRFRRAVFSIHSPIVLAGLVAVLIAFGVVALEWAERTRDARLNDSVVRMLGNPTVARGQFYNAYTERSGELTRDDIRTNLPWLADRFDDIDTDRNGTISAREFEQLLMREAARGTGQGVPDASDKSRTRP